MKPTVTTLSSFLDFAEKPAWKKIPFLSTIVAEIVAQLIPLTFFFAVISWF